MSGSSPVVVGRRWKVGPAKPSSGAALAVLFDPQRGGAPEVGIGDLRCPCQPLVVSGPRRSHLLSAQPGASVPQAEISGVVGVRETDPGAGRDLGTSVGCRAHGTGARRAQQPSKRLNQVDGSEARRMVRFEGLVGPIVPGAPAEHPSRALQVRRPTGQRRFWLRWPSTRSADQPGATRVPAPSAGSGKTRRSFSNRRPIGGRARRRGRRVEPEPRLLGALEVGSRRNPRARRRRDGGFPQMDRPRSAKASDTASERVLRRPRTGRQVGGVTRPASGRHVHDRLPLTRSRICR